MLFVDMSRCILSKFYIKPQRRRWLSCCFSVVSYRNSTSNHNASAPLICSVLVVSYRNSTSNHNNKRKEACQNHVVSYRNSTSNHNESLISSAFLLLYLIEILHQTTTPVTDILSFRCCILSKFYIKPQHTADNNMNVCVVSYRNSTSNHNSIHHEGLSRHVVSYRNSTSNHNSSRSAKGGIRVVSYRNSTSNHNFRTALILLLRVVSYRNSTSNHNASPPII